MTVAKKPGARSQKSGVRMAEKKVSMSRFCECVCGIFIPVQVSNVNK